MSNYSVEKMRKTLFVAGFSGRTRARDLAYEFERYGRLVRCDIPAPKSYAAKVYAFVEFEDPYDAEDAYNDMHGKCVDGYTLSVQWARKAPNATWRLGPSNPPPPPPPLPSSDISSRHIPPYYRYNERRRPSMSPPRGRSPPHYLRIRRYSMSRSRSRSPIPTNTNLSIPSSSSYHHHHHHHNNYHHLPPPP